MTVLEQDQCKGQILVGNLSPSLSPNTTNSDPETPNSKGFERQKQTKSRNLTP